MTKLTLFLDLGCRGGVAIFKGKKLVQAQSFSLTKNRTMSPQNKVVALFDWLKTNCAEPEKYAVVGTYEPLNKSYRTVINLSFLVGIVMLYFRCSTCVMINEGDVFRSCLKTNQIPLRRQKKQATIAWANQEFQLNLTNDDVADAIAGGYFLARLSLSGGNNPR